MRPEGAAEFADWYGATSARVRRAVALAVGDAGLAEEATAEAYARALLHWPTVRAARRPDAWVYTVALNHVRSRMRRVRLERRWIARQRAGHEPPPEEPHTALWAAVAQLAPRARTAVALRYVADLSEAEVAAAMGVTRGTAASTLQAPSPSSRTPRPRRVGCRRCAPGRRGSSRTWTRAAGPTC